MFISAKTALRREMVSDSLEYVDQCEEKLSIIAAGEQVDVNRNLFLIFCPLLRQIVDDLQTKILIIPSVKVSSLLLLQDLLLGLGHPTRQVKMTEKELLMDLANILGLDLSGRLESIPASNENNDSSGGEDRFFLEREVIEECSNTDAGNMEKSPLDYGASYKCLPTQSICSTEVLEKTAITEKNHLSVDNGEYKVSEALVVRNEKSVKHMNNSASTSTLFNPYYFGIIPASAPSEKNSDKPNQINITSNLNCLVDIPDKNSLFLEGNVTNTKSLCHSAKLNVPAESCYISNDPIKEIVILNKTGEGNFLKLKPIEQLIKTNMYANNISRFSFDRNTAMDEVSQKKIDHFIKECSKVEKDVLLSVPKESSKLNTNGETIPRKSYTFPCMNCNFGTDNSEHIKIHVRVDHMSEYSFKCNQCPISSPLYSTLTKHKCLKQVSNNDSMIMVNKPICPDMSKRQEKNLQHVSSCGSTVSKPLILCMRCGRRHSEPCSLPLDNVCSEPYCAAPSGHSKSLHHPFNDEDYKIVKDKCSGLNIWKNKNNSQSMPTTYPCNSCSYTSTNPKRVIVHSHKIHKLFHKFTCDKCYFEAPYHRALDSHQCNMTGSKPKFKCQYCDFSKDKMKLVNRHVKKQHNDIIEELLLD